MIQEAWTLGGRELTFAAGWQEDASLRQKLHPLTRDIFGFDFEKWYQCGYWTDKCIPYSLMEGNRVVSHITVSRMEFLWNGQERHYVQLGTVLTAPDCRGRGLSRALMERVLADWRDRCDMVYLFANETVLEFYPRFGFTMLQESEASFALTDRTSAGPVRRLNMDDSNDRDLLRRMAAGTAPQSALSMRHNPELVMFYCSCFDGLPYPEQLYWLESLSAVAVAHREGDTLIISDVFSPRQTDVRVVAAALAGPETARVVLEFLPPDTGFCRVSPFVEEDGALFAMGPDAERMRKIPFRFPILSHT